MVRIGETSFRGTSRIYRAAVDGLGGGGGAGPAGRFNKLSIYDLKGKLAGVRVLVRADFNVSDKKTGEIKSDTRIKAGLETIKFLIQEGAQVVVISHNERPKDLLKDGVPETEVRTRLSLDKAAQRLEELLGQPVGFIGNTVGSEVQKAAAVLQNGQVIMLENTRFFPEDEKGVEGFARKIVDDTGAKLFVLDGFSVAHRDQASVTGVARVIRGRGGLAVAGHLLQQEIDFLGQKLIEAPARPYVAFMGGAKVADKIKVIDNLLDNVDILVIGGAMLYPFLRARSERMGVDPLGRSEDQIVPDIEAARRVLTGPNYDKVLLPWKMVMADNKIKDVDDGELVKMLRLKIDSRYGTPGTIVWNGPFGQVEVAPYDCGTIALLGYISEAKQNGAITITGGGDTEKAIKTARQAGVEVRFSHISTGGGAMLELLEGKELPGITVLNDK